MAISYATTTELAQCMSVKKVIPTWAPGVNPTTLREEVGTGDNSNLLFYLDQRNVLASSYTLYYGATSATTTTLTETTHYTLSKDDGIITLTSAGRTLLDTNKIYAIYSYVSIDLSDSYLNTVLTRAEAKINKGLNTTFVDGTATNPAYQSNVEYQPSKGKHNRVYFSQEYPLIDVTSAISGSDLNDSATTFDVNSGDGASFPSTGTIIIGSEKMTYSISTDTMTVVRGVDDSTAATHSEGDLIHTTVVEVSGTYEGSNVVWNVLAHDSQVDVHEEEGKIYIYRDQIINQIDYSRTIMARQDVANRFRLTYLSGYQTIPADINRLTLLVAKQMLVHDTVSAALIQGRDEFDPTLTNVENKEIESIMEDYKSVKVSNT